MKGSHPDDWTSATPSMIVPTMRLLCSVAMLLSSVAGADVPAQNVEGVMLRGEEDVVREVESQLRGTGKWSRPDDYSAVDGLGRAIAAAGPWLPVFARTLAAHLEDADVGVRTIAVFLLERVAKEVGAAKILAVLERSPRLFDGVKPVGHPTNQPDLRWSLLMALGSAVGPQDTAALQVLRKAAHEERGSWLLGALGRADSAWLLENAKLVVPKKALIAAVRALPDTTSRQALIRALGPWTAEEKKAALASPGWALVPDAEKLKTALK